MHELSTDLEVTFRKVLRSAEILPARPGVDPLEVARPLPDLSGTSQSSVTASPSVIARSRSGSVPPAASYVSTFSVLNRIFGQHQTNNRQTPHSYISVTTCETVAVVHRQPCLQHLACCSVNSRHIGAESRFLPTPPAFDAPSRGGGSRRNIAIPFGAEKLEWCGCSTVKKFRRYLYSF